MRLDTSLMLLVASLAFAATVSVRAAAAPAAQAAAPAAQPSPEDIAGRTSLEQVCTLCHDTSLIVGGTRTVAEWDDVLERMAANGASASEQEAERIRAYLLRSYGRVNVNRAPAKDLAPVLNVDAMIAEAVVAYRIEQGGFKTIDDLKKVPGIDAAKIDARRDRLMF